MNTDEILYIKHEADGKNSAELVRVENEDATTKISPESEQANKTEASANKNTDKTEQTTEAKATEAQSEEVVTVHKETNPSEAPKASAEPEEPEDEPEEEPEDTVVEPRDKIEQITISSGTLPLPSEETEDIEPLLPY